MRTISAERPDTTEVAVILGVDTHLDFHVAVAVDHLGRRLRESSVPTIAKGYQRLLCWAEDFGPVRCAGVEGTSSYGAGLAHHLRACGDRGFGGGAPEAPAAKLAEQPPEVRPFGCRSRRASGASRRSLGRAQERRRPH